jgi:hypothetical protein
VCVGVLLAVDAAEEPKEPKKGTPIPVCGGGLLVGVPAMDMALENMLVRPPPPPPEDEWCCCCDV